MKLSFFLFLLGATLASASEDEDCTHGMLFISDADSTIVRAMDLNSDDLSNLAVVASLDLDEIPVPELVLATSGSTEEVAVIYRGQEDQGYQDGAVRFIDTASAASGTLSMVENAAFNCARAIHFVPHDDKIAIFCDGILSNMTQVNSTVWILDETLFGGDDTAIVFQTRLQGSHHGVAVPIDDNHVLYSLATPERIGGNYSASSLPNTFEIVDYDGNVLHSIADTTSPDTSCSGFHGSYAVENKFALACDDDHGGIVILDYSADDVPTNAYTSRALFYPEEYQEHRTGSFAEHHDAEMAVGNFANSTHNHLMSFTTDDMELTADQVLALPDRPCAYDFEQGSGEWMLVFLPNGELQVYQVVPEWELLAKMVIIEGMQECSEAIFKSGYGQAFALHSESQTLYSIDLDHASHGDIDVYQSSLGFTPFSAIVAGVPRGTGCQVHDHADHDHANQDHLEGDSSAIGLFPIMIAFAVTTIINLFVGSFML